LDLFQRDSDNPILAASGPWWEARGVLNPGVATVGRNTCMIYRAVGADGISRFGRAISPDGRTFERDLFPVYEAAKGDWAARLGVEDPRITRVGEIYFTTYAKVSVEPAGHPKLTWEPAPFRIRSWIASSADLAALKEIGPVLADTTSKDLVLFPEQIGGRYVALVREFPSIQLTTSPDLREWSDPVVLMGPIPGTWEGERVGAGPPPLRISSGWLLMYHANEYLRLPDNQRLYRMGLALLHPDDPSRLLYRHPEPIFEPVAAYEREGPVGNVVFGTGLIEDGSLLSLYYGAADGVIGLATADMNDVLALLPRNVRRA
jgi:beta-1,2-mannobiose phosphorylase / 1,2-beta-oligomannan phosphorylase